MSSKQVKHEAMCGECNTRCIATDTKPQLISMLTAMQVTMDKQNMFLERIFNEKQAAERSDPALQFVPISLKPKMANSLLQSESKPPQRLG